MFLSINSAVGHLLQNVKGPAVTSTVFFYFIVLHCVVDQDRIKPVGHFHVSVICNTSPKD